MNRIQRNIEQPSVSSRDVVLSRYIPKGSSSSMGSRRRRGRRTRGRGRRTNLLGPRSPGIWSPPPFIRTARRATSGWGRSVGSGIGDILSTGLNTVANRGSKLVKQEAKKHGTKIAKSIHSKGQQMVKSGLTTAKRRTKSAVRKKSIATQKKVAKALSSALSSAKHKSSHKKRGGVKRLASAVKSITKSKTSRKHRSSSRRKSVHTTGTRRRRRRHRGFSKKRRIGLSNKSLIGLL